MKYFSFCLLVIVISLNGYAQTQLFGVTSNGGQFNSGVIFKTDSSGNNYSIENDFFQIEGDNPAGSLIQASDGKLYGLTSWGVPNNNGVLFQYDPLINKYTKKFDFDTASRPFGSLIQASDGMLYGMTSAGGLNNKGVLFKYDPINNVYTNKIHFSGIANGSNPVGSLMQASDGKLYGMTRTGGANNLGVLFQYNPITNILIKKMDFTTANGAEPNGDLMQASDGKLYGMTKLGGMSNAGVLFQYDFVNNIYVKKYDFDGFNNGGNPYGSLIQANDGNLYGMTDQGNSWGVIFQYNLSTDLYTKKFVFLNTSTGSNPRGGLLQATDGKLYGLTYGGQNGTSGLFQYDYISNVFVKKLNYAGATNGYWPLGSLIQATDGKIYGMFSEGGLGSGGVIFQYDPVTSLNFDKVNFCSSPSGFFPTGRLVQVSDGSLYGMTAEGGANAKGVLFKYDSGTHSYVKKIDFNGLSNGSGPVGELILAADGNLYGVTFSGGTNGKGTLFQYNPINNVLTKKVDFNGTINGTNPMTSLIQATDGKIYGTCKLGGVNDEGVLFQYDPSNNVLIKKLDFDASTIGSYPLGSLIQASDGKLYGTAYSGGNNGYGTLFQYDISSNSCIKKIDFNINVTGTNPAGALVEVSNGIFYGTTCDINSGTGRSVLYEYNSLTNGLTVKLDFFTNNVATGFNPLGNLTQYNGKLYGMAKYGGVYNLGTLFEYDPLTNVFLKKLDFNKANGSRPVAGLTAISLSINTQSISLSNCLGSTLNIPFQIIGSYDLANVFTAQLSDSTGSFAAPINIGSVLSHTQTSISATIPLQMYPGNGYRIRIVSSNPAVIGNDNGSDISLHELPVLTINSGAICSGNSFVISPTGASTYTYSSGTNTITPTSSNTYTITGANTFGCLDSITTLVTVDQTVPSLAVTGPSLVCIGSSATFSVTGASNYTWTNGSINPVIIVTETVSTTYTVTGANACGVTDQVVLLNVDNTCADVWPGDANSDGVSNNLDILELGLHFGQSGSARGTVSNSWQSYFANNWIGTIASGENLNHSDCNGDGIINNDDTLAIFNNYGLTHAKSLEIEVINPQLTIVPDQATVLKGNWGTASIYLGDAANSISNINGIAFTVDFDNNLIESDSIYIEYQNSFFDSGQNLHFNKLDFVNGKIYSASTHTISNNVNGFGKIATLHYQVLSNLTSDQVLNIGISQANKSDANGLITPLTSGTGTLMAISASVGFNQEDDSKMLAIIPNPSTGFIKILGNETMQNVSITNIAGQILLSEIINSKSHQLQLQNFAEGIYFVKVVYANGMSTTKKVIVSH